MNTRSRTSNGLTARFASATLPRWTGSGRTFFPAPSQAHAPRFLRGIRGKRGLAGRMLAAASEQHGFTLIELLVVIAIIAILASLLLPVLAKSKANAWRIQCSSQMKQLGLAFNLFTTDHNDTYPPTAISTGDYEYQLSWDDYIHRYIGGSDSDADLLLGITDGDHVPQVLKCPADRIEITISYATYGARRTYAMNWAGPGFVLASAAAPLPPAKYGVGVYYNLRSSAGGKFPPWDPPGYKVSAIADNSGTILLAEEPNGRNIAGNDWPSFCAGPGPSVPGGLTPDCVQTSSTSVPSSSNENYGSASYGLHSSRFNYLFHDGHVATLKINDTIGSGTLANPHGMWTMTAND